MIWIKNHGVSGRSDNLRELLAADIESVTTHAEDPEGSPAIVVMDGWTGVAIDNDYDDVRQPIRDALGPQVVFADEVDSDEHDTMADELDERY